MTSSWTMEFEFEHPYSYILCIIYSLSQKGTGNAWASITATVTILYVLLTRADSAFDTIMVHQVAITARHSPHYCWGQKPHELQDGEWWSHTHSWFVNRAALGLIKSPLNNFFTRDISDFVMYLAYRFTYTGIWCHRSWAGVAYQIGIRISIFRQGLFIVKHWKITNGNLVLHTPGQLCDCCPQLVHLTWANVHGFYIHGFSASIWGKT